MEMLAMLIIILSGLLGVNVALYLTLKRVNETLEELKGGYGRGHNRIRSFRVTN